LPGTNFEDWQMVARTVKTALLIMLAGTVSMTSLALPAARAITATLPESHGAPLSCAQIKRLISRTQNGFGDIAAEVACTYLKKLGVLQGTSPAGRADAEGRTEIKAAERGAGASLASER
jgi:hypothetical protein